MNNMLMIKNNIVLGLITLIICGYCCCNIVYAQNTSIVYPEDELSIDNNHSPMYQAAQVLYRRYKIPITYEDPIFEPWSGDLDQIELQNGKMRNISKRLSFKIPKDANPYENPILNTKLINKVLNAYQEQTDGPRFRVIASNLGFHIIPDQVRDSNGKFIKAVTFLDIIISVPIKTRTAMDHFQAIMDAIQAANSTGAELHPNINDLNYYFSPNQVSNISADDKFTFDWGVNHVNARDALITLFEKTNTTLTWALTCDRYAWCALSIYPIDVYYVSPNGNTARKYIFKDRLKKDKQ